MAEERPSGELPADCIEPEALDYLKALDARLWLQMHERRGKLPVMHCFFAGALRAYLEWPLQQSGRGGKSLAELAEQCEVQLPSSVVAALGRPR